MAGRTRILVFERMDPTDRSLDWLSEKGLDLTLGKRMSDPGFERYGEDQIIAAARGHGAVMGASGAHFTRRVIEALPELRFISKFGIGYDSIDVAAASGRGILVSNTPDDFNLLAVAEHTIASILALKKQLLTWTPAFMRHGGWLGDVFARYLHGNTVGIVGLGRIGRAVAQRLAGWQVEIIAYDHSKKEPMPGVTLVDLPTLMARADVVTLHATPNAGNRHMIDRAELALMKPTALLINTARAALINYDALREAVAEKRIAGVALDVYEQEPPNRDDPLFRAENVLVTPHSAAWTYETLESMGWHGARNLWAMVSGEGAADIVNPEAKSRREVRLTG